MWCRGVLEAGKAWVEQEDYLQCRGAHLQPMHCCLKGLTPLLLPVNGILEGLEGREGMEGWSERIPTTQGIQHEWDVPPPPALSSTLIQAFFSSSDLGTKRELHKPLSLLPEGLRDHHPSPYLACSSSVRCFPETRNVFGNCASFSSRT